MLLIQFQFQFQTACIIKSLKGGNPHESVWYTSYNHTHMKIITYSMHHAIVITINAQFSYNPKFRNGKLTPSSK